VKERCAICDFELTEYDLSYKSINDLWPHCKEHSNHATYPQLWLLKKELNLPYNEPTLQERVCAVCGSELSDEEMKFVEKTHFNLVCKFHKRKFSDLNIELTRENLGIIKPIIYEILKQWNL
jgi:hypothetical protein